MSSFENQLKAFAKKTDARLNVVVKKIVLDISVKLVLRSPVGDAKYWKSKPPPGYVGGRFRGNWQYGLNAANVTTSMNIDKNGKDTILAVNSQIPETAIGVVHYLTNSLPYAKRLEEGYSRQAPKGMVLLTAIEFEPIVKEAAAQLK